MAQATAHAALVEETTTATTLYGRPRSVRGWRVLTQWSTARWLTFTAAQELFKACYGYFAAWGSVGYVH